MNESNVNSASVSPASHENISDYLVLNVDSGPPNSVSWSVSVLVTLSRSDSLRDPTMLCLDF